MDLQRKQWNQSQQALQKALSKTGEHSLAVDLFLRQHAAVHTSAVGQTGDWSFEDEVLQDLSDQAARWIPPKMEHSIAWMIWHITRIEDMTMNTLVANEPQIFAQENWPARMNASVRDTGNTMNAQEIAQLSAAIDLPALRDYRAAVGLRTREVIRQLPPELLKQKVSADRLKILADQGDVLPDAYELLEYWSGRTIGGLLLMPATRHPFVHFNEAMRVKQSHLRLK